MLAELAERSGIRPAGRTDPDATPPLPAEADVYVQPGELWRLGEHRLLVDDSTHADAVARLFAGQSASLMATDPPYLIGYQGGNHPQSWHNRPAVRDKHWDDYVDPAASEAFFRSFLTAARPHLAPHVALYQWHAHRRQALVEAAWHSCGLLVHQQLIWVKARAVLTHSHYLWQHEPCFYGWVEGAPPLRKPPANGTTVWEVDQVGESDGLHPTRKPIELFARPIAYHTRPGEICYDPFLGSGTALVAAEAAGRRCYGLEISPAYAQVCIERWQAFTGLKAVRHG
jgi:DNA modification methylase